MSELKHNETASSDNVPCDSDAQDKVKAELTQKVESQKREMLALALVELTQVFNEKKAIEAATAELRKENQELRKEKKARESEIGEKIAELRLAREFLKESNAELRQTKEFLKEKDAVVRQLREFLKEENWAKSNTLAAKKKLAAAALAEVLVNKERIEENLAAITEVSAMIAAPHP